VLTNVSDENIASIFRVEEMGSAKTSKEAGGNSTNYTAS
jgi:hypothetical protein